MKKILFCFLIIAYSKTQAQQLVSISTSDIQNFWQAYDSLGTSKDSVATIQKFYLDRASAGLKEFIKVRNLKAPEYVRQLHRYPKFWKSIRANTERIASQKKEIEDALSKFDRVSPSHKKITVCFAIGCLRTAGTVSSNFILIGSEMASSDKDTDKTELKGWLANFVGSNTNNLTATIAHEFVHTQHKLTLAFTSQYINRRLLAASCREGAADFVSQKVAGTTINQFTYEYGNAHLADLRKEFQLAMNGKDISQWLYNGGTKMNRPADLGYFMGYKICEAYFNQAKDKEKALTYLMKVKNPAKILRKGRFY